MEGYAKARLDAIKKRRERRYVQLVDVGIMPLHEKPMLFRRAQAFEKQIPHFMEFGISNVLPGYVNFSINILLQKSSELLALLLSFVAGPRQAYSSRYPTRHLGDC